MDIALTALLCILCLLITVKDTREFRIPNTLNAALAVSGIIAILTQMLGALITHIISAGIAFLLAYLIGELLFRRTGKEWLGIGDAKLLGAATLWIGPVGLPSMILIASLTAIPFALLFTPRGAGVPFGPFLCLGLISVWLHGPIMI